MVPPCIIALLVYPFDIMQRDTSTRHLAGVVYRPRARHGVMALLLIKCIVNIKDTKSSRIPMVAYSHVENEPPKSIGEHAAARPGQPFTRRAKKMQPSPPSLSQYKCTLLYAKCTIGLTPFQVP